MKKALIFITLTVLLFGCRGNNSGGTSTGGTAERQNAAQTLSIGIFIPGVMSGSPIYEMLAQGVQRAAEEEAGVETTVVEGGYNQAEWESRVTSMAASGDYDLIVSSNPSLPTIAAEVSAKFPKQRFLLLDGELSGNPSIFTMRYNQREQAYMAGHLAALVANASGQGQARIGLVAAQEYPVMNDTILPGYQDGAQAVDPAFTVDFRVVGNWFDAERGAQIAEQMIRSGVPVILPIAGGAGTGVLQAASETGAKVVWFDINGYDLRPGTVVGSAVLRQDRAAYEQTKRYLEGRLPFGSAEVVGVTDGYVDFIEDDPLYIAAVSPEIRKAQSILIEQIRSGTLILGE
ncbi:MAG: BMP family ABC transporter substrate-binding protein [Treponema sp.]|jgi:simple sugar transport system substrate-binding protein|nr:BMP family ABC transporter substrate-binding protein [Treponema sp.]